MKMWKVLFEKSCKWKGIRWKSCSTITLAFAGLPKSKVKKKILLFLLQFFSSNLYCNAKRNLHLDAILCNFSEEDIQVEIFYTENSSQYFRKILVFTFYMFLSFQSFFVCRFCCYRQIVPANKMLEIESTIFQVSFIKWINPFAKISNWLI